MLMKVKICAAVLACILLMLLGVPRLSGAQAHAQIGDLGTLARSACAGVGEVRHVSPGSTGAPILVLEEYHLSRVGQLQHAITLTRLYERYGLKRLVLEGYLKEDPEIKTDWFISAAQGLSRAARTRVAVRLLREGEISSAEFAKLIYRELTLYPGETRDEYRVNCPRRLRMPRYVIS